MARKKREEMEFGSDSFLDVLANIVGILIILIVVEGVRVTNAHRHPKKTVPVEPEVTAAIELEVPNELPELPDLPPLPELKPTPEMLEQAAKLKSEYATLTAQLEKLETEQERLLRLKRDSEVQLSVLRQQVSEKVDKIRSDHSQVSTLETNVVQLKAEVAALEQRLVDINKEDGPVEVLTHRLPPIGKVVTGDEIHFRLEGNRVTHVPIEALVKDVQRDIERRKEILISRSFYQGTTRAIDGYVMEYVLQRLASTVADELRSGPGMVRIGVTSWVIRPVGPLRAETADQALQSNSAFRDAMKNASPTATVTFWVYPDSFEIHHKLTRLTQDGNFWVASRPLPTGVPIAGSPNGSKSVAQ